MAGISIADIILILVSAFGGAWANSWYRNREAKKAEHEERKGLLFLIASEVRYNHLLLDATSLGPPSGPISGLQADVWDRTQTRLAQLLPADYMHSFVTYYGLMRTKQMSSLVRQKNASDGDRAQIKQMQAIGGEILREAQNYIEDPAFVDLTELDLVEDFKRRHGV